MAWDERARMARLYEGFSIYIKDTMAVREFPDNWVKLINLSSRLDDNFRRRDAENKGWKFNALQNKLKQKYPDEIN
jgi:hypothetical protein